MNKTIRCVLFPVLILIAHMSIAQQYPERPVRLVVPFAAGGAIDIQTRMLAEMLSQNLGQQFIVDNRGGANGNIGMQLVAKAVADGYTLVTAGAGTWAVNVHLYKLPFDPVKDFAPIIRAASSPAVLVVHPAVPVKNVKELVALAKARPDQLNYGSSGVGGLGHISGALFSLMSGAKIMHIPYKGGAPALTALISGQIEILFNNPVPTKPLIVSGKARALAVTGQERIAALPDLPTVSEAGVKGYDNSSWLAVAAPAGTPVQIIARLNGALNEILKYPDIRERFAAAGADIVGGTPEQFSDYLRSEIKKYGRVIREAKIKAE